MRTESSLTADESRTLAAIGQKFADGIEDLAVEFCADTGRKDPTSVGAAVMTITEAMLFLLINEIYAPDDQAKAVRELSASVLKSLAGWQAELRRRGH